ncbi:MAG TPA: hypothetical protein VGG38_18415 [Acidimicrobiales bacterium]|jgi:haloalkane dehalogenase
MEFFRTPDQRFENLPGFDVEPRYVALANGLRLHYVEMGPPTAPPVLLLHGQPT